MNDDMSARENPATIREVANRAGVSVGTVSRVLNRHENITRKNMEKVQEAIAALSYRKCRSAEMLVSRRSGSRVSTGNIGMAFASMDAVDTNHPLVACYTLGAEQACREQGFHTLVELCGTENILPRCVREGKVDGLLVKATYNLPEFVGQLPRNFPLVCITLNDPVAPVHQVAADERGAGWTVTEYLWQQGHRRIAFLSLDIAQPMLLGRYHGYESFLRSRRAFDPQRVAVEEMPGDPASTPRAEWPDTTAALQRIWLPQGKNPTAIIVGNDSGAPALFDALTARGLRIPDDVSVVGFDNAIGICMTVKPQLTSYAMPFAEVARRGALDLFGLIENPTKPRDRAIQLIRGDLIERASVRKLGA